MHMHATGSQLLQPMEPYISRRRASKADSNGQQACRCGVRSIDPTGSCLLELDPRMWRRDALECDHSRGMRTSARPLACASLRDEFMQYAMTMLSQATYFVMEAHTTTLYAR